MSDNREIRSDGNVIIKGLTYPSTDGSDGQVIKTNGAGVLSFVDQSTGGGGGGGVDTIASASDATSYSGTNRIIHVTSTDDVTFSTDLIGRVIIVAGSLSGGSTITPKVTIQNCHMIGCILRSSGNLDFKNTSTDGSSFTAFRYNTISANFITVSASGNTSGNNLQIQNSNITCNRFTINTVSNDVVAMDRNKIFAAQFFEAGTSSIDDVSLQDCHINTGDFKGYYDIVSGGNNYIVASEGTGGTLSFKIDSETYINGVYNHPFKVDKSGVQTSVIVASKNSQTQSLNGTENIDFDEENIDNTNAWSTDTFTAKVKGDYRVSSYFSLFNVTSRPSLGIYVNSSQLYAFSSSFSDSNGYYILHGNAVVSLDVGDTLNIKSISSDTSYSTYSAANSGVSIFIEKIN